MMFTHEFTTGVRSALTTAVVGETITVPKLTLDMLFDWFDRHVPTHQATAIVGFTYVEPDPGGAASYLQGLFCLATTKIIRMRRISGARSDRYVADLHRNESLVIYT